MLRSDALLAAPLVEQTLLFDLDPRLLGLEGLLALEVELHLLLRLPILNGLLAPTLLGLTRRQSAEQYEQNR